MKNLLVLISFSLTIFFTTNIFGQDVFISGQQEIFCESDSIPYRLDAQGVGVFAEQWYFVGPAPLPEIFVVDTNSILVNYNAQGTYVLYAQYFDPAGNTGIDSLFIFVGELGSGEIILEGCSEFNPETGCSQVCAGSTTTAFITSNISTGQWLITGAESIIDNGFSVDIVWGAAGSGSIEYFGECITASICIEKLPEPLPDFDATPSIVNDVLEVCTNQEIYFENSSQGGITYEWFFGDGGTSDVFEPNYRYSTPGTYTLILRANSVCECTAEKEITVNVRPEPSPTLDCINSVCPESRQMYTANTDGCSNFNWVVSPNGTIVNGGEATDDFIEIIWHTGPDGIIELTVSSCNQVYCSATNIFRVPIITPDGPIKGDISVCAGEITTHSAPYFLGTEYSWQVGPNGTIIGGQNSNAITIMWRNVLTTTAETITVDYNNCFLECGGSASFGVNISPTISINGDFVVCENSDATINAVAGFNSTSPVPVSWEIQDLNGAIVFQSTSNSNSLTHAFTYAPGQYYWIARNSNPTYCNEEIKQMITVYEVPPSPIDFSSEEQICVGVPYGFTIDNAGSYNTIWRITDGALVTTDEGSTITYTFTTAGPYLVEAAHTDVQFKACASPYISKALSSVADLTISGSDNVCNQSTHGYATDMVGGASYTWTVVPADMGEIRFISENEIEVFWSQAGIANLELNICGTTLVRSITINALPVFTVQGPTSTCSNTPVTISTDQPTMSHFWFNETDNLISANNTVDLGPGFYSVRVTDANGCTSEDAFEIESIAAPKALISSAGIRYYCSTVPGVELVSSANAAGYTYQWYLNGSPVGNNVAYTANDFGEYTLEISNSNGCVDLSEVFEIVDCCPITDCIGVGVGTGCGALSYNFMIDYSSASCSERTFSIGSPDLEPGTGTWYIKAQGQSSSSSYNSDIANHRYEYPGYYYVQFSGKLNAFVYPNGTCKHFEYGFDTVKMISDFNFDKVCVGLPTQFTDLSTYMHNETIVSYAWDFGDPTSGAANVSTDQNPMHTFAAGGNYDVTLIATAASGCTSTIIKEVLVSGGPPLTIDHTPIFCEDEAAAFSVTGNLFNIVWEFDDAVSGVENMASDDEVFHTYITPALYNVKVGAEDIYGCYSEVISIVDIKANTLTGNLTLAPNAAICEGETVLITAPVGGVEWTWNTSENTESITTGIADQYDVFMRDVNMCSYAPPSEYVAVDPKPAVDIRGRLLNDDGSYGPWVDRLEICDGESFELSAFANTGATYIWGSGQTTQALNYQSTNGNYPNPGITSFDVTATSIAGGCASDPSLFELEMYVTPNTPSIAMTAGSGCSFDVNTLSVTNVQTGITYQWSDGQTGPSINTSSSGEYSVVGTNPNGCSAESNMLNILASPEVDKIAGGCFLECDPLTVCLPSLSNVSAYTIYQNGSTVHSSGGVLPADYLITQDGSYTVEVTSTNGCTATSLPLDVVLYTGVGTITVLTYEDIDHDGIITAADQLLGSIPVQILSDDGLHKGMTDTEADGKFDFRDFPATNYEVTVDRDALNPMWRVVIDSLNTNIATCDDSVSVSLLLDINCEVFGPNQILELCPGPGNEVTYGDSTFTALGTYEVHFTSINGCDSIEFVDVHLPTNFTMEANVWVDVDMDGTVSFGDTLAGNINFSAVEIISSTTTNFVSINSGPVTASLTTGGYNISLDLASIPISYLPIISSVSVADGFCGTFEANFLLQPNCLPTIVTDDATICFGDSVLVGNEYQFETDIYSVIISDPSSACDTTLQFTLTVLPELMVSPIVEVSCFNNGAVGTVSFVTFGEGPFVYSMGGLSQTDSIFENVAPGIYPYEVMDQNGCTISDTLEIEGNSDFVFYIDTVYSVEAGQPIDLIIQGPTNLTDVVVEWSPSTGLSCTDCFNPTAILQQTQMYSILITDTVSGCTNNLETLVDVFISGTDFFMPNIFSPNNDGLNDILRVESWDPGAKIIDLKVVNRWGSLLHRETNVNISDQIGWNGEFNKQLMESQVVIYVAQIELSNGEKQEYSGDILLIR